jgi:hypothetical protein
MVLRLCVEERDGNWPAYLDRTIAVSYIRISPRITFEICTLQQARNSIASLAGMLMYSCFSASN